MRAWADRLHGPLLVALGVAIPLGEGVAGAALVLLALALVLRRDARAVTVFSPGASTTWAMGGFAVWIACGVLALASSGLGWLDRDEAARWLPLLALPVVAASVRSLDAVWLRRAVAGFALSLFAACLFALATHVLNVRPLEWLMRTTTHNEGQGRVPGRFGETVAGGFYFHRLRMAHVLLVGVALLAARQLFGKLEGRRRWLELAVGATFGVTLLLTYARGAALAAFGAVLLALPFASRRMRTVGLGTLAVGAASVLSMASVRERLVSSIAANADESRVLIWGQAVRVLADHPLGVGLGNYSTVIGRYYDLLDPTFTVRTYAHSIVLSAWAETGPVGALGFLSGLLVVGVFGVLVVARRQGTVEQRVAAGTAFVGSVALALVGLTHDVLFHNAVAFAFASMLGACAPLIDAARPMSATGESPKVER